MVGVPRAARLAGKLASPFVAKVGSALAPAAASAGAAAGGPVGVLMGATLGFAVDYAIAKGIELRGRPEFEKDVAFALRTAQSEWRYAMETELRRAVATVVDDAVQLTAAAYQHEPSRQRSHQLSHHQMVVPATDEGTRQLSPAELQRVEGEVGRAADADGDRGPGRDLPGERGCQRVSEAVAGL